MDECDVDSMLGDLKTKRFIDRYISDGVKVIEILNFEKHQHPHQNETASELPSRDSSSNYKSTPCISRTLPEITGAHGLSSVSLTVTDTLTVTESELSLMNSKMNV